MLQAHQLSKNYGSFVALRNLELEIPQSCIFGLLGPNGAGKTSFIRILNQIIAPDSGQLTWEGQSLGSEHNSSIGYLPEERGLYPRMPVGEQLVYLARLKGMPRSDARRHSQEWLERFALSEWRNKNLEELSKGMAQKVQFIATVLHQPRLLIFDEPFSGFDPVNTETIKGEILRLRKEGATVIFSTHRMDSVEEICDRIALLHHGEKLLDGSLQSVKEKYRSGLYKVELRGQQEPQWPSSLSPLRKSTSPSGNGIYWLELSPENRAELWRFLQEQPLLRFEEEEPRLHDIFVKLVQAQ